MPDDDQTLESLIKAELGGRDIDLSIGADRVTDVSDDLVGLALSGGGIRSATFNLGLLQGLHHFGLLERLDYLSTVSGGGYIGSFWTAWRQRQQQAQCRENGEPAAGGPTASAVFPAGTGSDGGSEPDPVRHLREFSNFLAPHLGLLSWDTGRIVVTLISSLVPSLLAAFSIIALAVVGWCALAYGLFASSTSVSIAVFVGASALLLILMEMLWRRSGEEFDLIAHAEAWAWGLMSAGTVWAVLLSMPEMGLRGWYAGFLPGPARGQPQQGLYLFAPVIPWMAASLAMSLRRWGGSRRTTGHARRLRRTSFDRVHARFVFAAAVWSVIALLWWAGALVRELADNWSAVSAWLGGATAAVVLLFARIQKYASADTTDRVGAGLAAKVRAVLPPLLAPVAIALMVVSVVVGLIAFEESDYTYPTATTVAVTAALSLLLVALLFNPNEIGLHTFYRARIARAYLGASNTAGKARRKTEEHEDDDFRLSDIRVPGPCHLICCAANDLANRELGNLHRGAVSGVLSPVGLSVGGRVRRWKEDDGCTPTLSEAVTASAAAFNPLMGAQSKALGPTVTFLMAAFNLRLGLWLRQTGSPSRLERLFVGLPFFMEMFGQASATGSNVHLSDGAHFENTGIYELIRRHCRFIIASDCGMDPTVSFDDFGKVIRSVRADFGVDIRINLSALRPDATGISAQPMVAGDIHYPEGDIGILLLIKPAITGAEPADVAQYRSRNVLFPHESTSDQFYSEAQWEAYRRLGEHAAHSAFRRLGADLDQSRDSPVNQIFLRARREWLGVPDGFGERLSRFADRMEHLDNLLRQPECAALLREVYKEINDLDHQQKRVAEGASNGSEDDPPVQRTAQHAPLPDPADLAPSLHLIRCALLLMQEAYVSENLEENYNHPAYLGLINYFARWAFAPLFRLWWPLLKTMYPQPFTRFVEHHYGIPTDEALAGELGEPSREVRGFAMSVWQQQNPVPLRADQIVVPFRLTLRYLGHHHQIQAAQVIATTTDDCLAWDADDFFVPPGLWGVGIGGRFLHLLRERVAVQAGAIGAVAAADGEAWGFKRLYVRVRLDGVAGAAARAQSANEVQLYRSAGFELIRESDVPARVAGLMKSVRKDTTREARGASAKWMATPLSSPMPRPLPEALEPA